MYGSMATAENRWFFTIAAMSLVSSDFSSPDAPVFPANTEHLILIDIIKGNEVASAKQEHLIIHGVNGRVIVARSANQQLLAKSFEENDLTFAIGPAGSGKTFVAIALAVKALKSKQVRRIMRSSSRGWRS